MYVFSTRYFGITFQKGNGLEKVEFAEGDHANKATGRKSGSGGATMCARRVFAGFLGRKNESLSKPLRPIFYTRI